MTTAAFPSIGADLAAYLLQNLQGARSRAVANEVMQRLSGILDFFPTEEDWLRFQSGANAANREAEKAGSRAEFGDFQTPPELADRVCNLLKNRGLSPEIIIEPTCGKGNFVMAALRAFESIRMLVGVEINAQYVWEAKFAVADFFRKNPRAEKPEIRLICQDVFQFDFAALLSEQGEILVLGNPPWATNAMLSTLNSGNLPRKSNFKNHAGLDAITGKSNFDLGEYIATVLVQAFEGADGHFALLVKNAVVKNLVQAQRQRGFRLSDIEQHEIDALREFGAAVEASLLLARFGAETPAKTCRSFDFYAQKARRRFGWVAQNFVSDTEKYKAASHLEGECPFVWRQGVKHDCAKIMELERENGHFINGLGEAAALEPDLVFRLLKSSDLKKHLIRDSRKFTIITQQSIGQSTRYIQQQFPRTWDYLMRHQGAFEGRKSSIYSGKPPFSIFGIGDYAFQPYKVAISGLYKTAVFSLVLPDDGRPVMLDDTCYFIGFPDLMSATITTALLNAKPTQALLQALIFWDSKRPITKDLLMRLDLEKIAAELGFEALADSALSELPSISFSEWESYRRGLQSAAKHQQLAMF